MYCTICGKKSDKPICAECLNLKLVEGKVTMRKVYRKGTSSFVTLPHKSLKKNTETVSMVEVADGVILVIENPPKEE